MAFRKASQARRIALGDFVEYLRNARRSPTHADDGWVEFDDPDETNVMLSRGLPDEAYRALLDANRSDACGGMIMSDAHQRPASKQQA